MISCSLPSPDRFSECDFVENNKACCGYQKRQIFNNNVDYCNK